MSLWTSDEIRAAAASAQASHLDYERIFELQQPSLEAMDRACTMVIALGYKPEQCMIVIDRDNCGVIEKRTLEVLGRPVFEVTIETRPVVPPNWTFEVITTPRVIAWPEAVA